jgi:NADPH-dependent 7-cyano-7-deazaguanine reductase QueF
MEIGTVDNKYRDQETKVRLIVDLGRGLCPVSDEPLSSVLYIYYTSGSRFVEIRQINKLVEELSKEPIDMETMTQIVARELSIALGVPVQVEGEFELSGGIKLSVSTKSHILRR